MIIKHDKELQVKLDKFLETNPISNFYNVLSNFDIYIHSFGSAFFMMETKSLFKILLSHKKELKDANRSLKNLKDKYRSFIYVLNTDGFNIELEFIFLAYNKKNLPLKLFDKKLLQLI